MPCDQSKTLQKRKARWPGYAILLKRGAVLSCAVAESGFLVNNIKGFFGLYIKQALCLGLEISMLRVSLASISDSYIAGQQLCVQIRFHEPILTNSNPIPLVGRQKIRNCDTQSSVNCGNTAHGWSVHFAFRCKMLSPPMLRCSGALKPDRLGLSCKATKCSDAGTGGLSVPTTNETSPMEMTTILVNSISECRRK